MGQNPKKHSNTSNMNSVNNGSSNLQQLNVLIPVLYKNKVVIGIDPGEITGLAVYKGSEILYIGERKTYDIVESMDYLSKFITYHDPFIVTIENFIVYRHKAKDLANNKLHTSMLIGALLYMLSLKGINSTSRSAQVAKNTVTDEHLKIWGQYFTPKQAKRHFTIHDNKEHFHESKAHYRDAQRHAIYEMLKGDGQQHLMDTTQTNKLSTSNKKKKKDTKDFKEMRSLLN